MRSWTEAPDWLRWRFVIWLRNPFVQMRFGVLLLIASTFGWIATQLLVTSEPPLILALSWFAVWLSGLTLVIVTDVGEVMKDTP